ncbi:MAG: tetratricopeptide repeat protein [Bdellovibrionota bacterium]
MEQRFYKVRLSSGRVLGPLDLARVKRFIAQNVITGAETVRLYPTGEWKDVNGYPEIADLLLQKLENRLEIEPFPEKVDLDDKVEVSGEEIVALEKPNALPPPPVPSDEVPSLPDATSNPSQITPELELAVVPDDTKPDPDKTLVLAASEDDKTVMYTPEDEERAFRKPEERAVAQVELGQLARDLKLNNPDQVESNRVDPAIANEKTQVLSLAPDPQNQKQNSEAPLKKKKRLSFSGLPLRQKAFIAVGISAALLLLFSPETTERPKLEPPFQVEMPIAQTPDPQKSESHFLEGLKVYNQDTVDGYKEASKLFRKAASLDPNNVRALCFLASSYMNLIDVARRDENYFNVITRLIELERAKGLDLAETVLADVELYHILGNPDAAINRIVEFSKSHQFGPEMFYYLSLSFYYKAQYPEALKYLNNIEASHYFSPKINYLYGLIYQSTGQNEDAIKSFREVVAKSPKHVKARAKLVELLFSKDNLTEANKHADFILQNVNLASKAELALVYYYHARMHLVAGREQEALDELELAHKYNPDSSDTLLELYTLKARMGAKVKEAQSKAKMFHLLAQGERALKEGKLETALAHFLGARDLQYSDPTPLLKLAEVFRRKGDLQSAKINYAKAVKLVPRRVEIYPKYIRILIDAYEFEEASNVLKAFKGLNPAVSQVDRLQGDFYFKQEKLQEAHAYYKRALSATNVDSSIYVAYASLMFKGSNFRDAAFYYGLARRFDPYNVEAVVGTGKALAEIEGLERGVEYVQTLVSQSPNKAALLNGIAEIYVQKGDYASAVKYAKNALTVDSGLAIAHKTRGDALAAQDKYKEALDAYLTYTNLAPLDPTGHIERYKLFLKKLDLKSGKDAIFTVIENFPKYPGVYYMLGELYRIGQDYKSAIEAAQVEIKNNPTYEDAYILAGKSYNLMGDYRNAIDALNRALKLNPLKVQALIQAGFANHMLKTYAAAQSMLERALALDQGNPEIHKRLGVLYHDLENRDKAKQHFRAYLDLYPDAPDRAEIERYLGG